MKSIYRIRTAAILVAVHLFAGSWSYAQNPNNAVNAPVAPNAPAPKDKAPGSLEGVATNFSALLGLGGNLTINPKLITDTGGENTTLGLQYDFRRKVVTNFLHSEQRFMDLDVHSAGLITLESRKSPNRMLNHGLRLSLENLWPDQWYTPEQAKEGRKVANELFTGFFLTRWGPEQQKWVANKTSPVGQAAHAEMAKIVGEAEAELAKHDTPYKKVIPDDENATWQVEDNTGRRVDISNVTAAQTVKYRSPLLLIWDLDGDAETDQTFRDIQFAGTTQLRIMVKPDWFDKPFALLRGYATPHNYLNANRGPYLYGGIGIVDAHNNESRAKITGGTDDVFPRIHFGVSYRAELWALTESKSLDLELQWRYYHELDAPASIRAQKLASTSYFRATLLFPGNYFLEYTDGKLPLDVEGASTVGVGWRYNF